MLCVPGLMIMDNLWTFDSECLFCAVKCLNYYTAMNPTVMDCNKSILCVEGLLICTALGPHSQGILVYEI